MDNPFDFIINHHEWIFGFIVVCLFIFFIRWQRGSGHQKLIMQACQIGDLEEVRLLLREVSWLAKGEDKNGMSPLHIAALSGHVEVAEALLNAGANVNARNKVGMTPLHAAVIGGHLRLSLLLLDRGADINAQDAMGNTPLYVASFDASIEIAQLLLSRGANASIRNNRGETAEKRASERHRKEVAAVFSETPSSQLHSSISEK